MSVTPSSPTDQETLDLLAFHTFPDTGFELLDQSIMVTGDQIDVFALVQDLSPTGGYFAQVLTPQGAFINDFGPLAAGTYYVNAEMWYTYWPDTEPQLLYDVGSLTFEVTGSVDLPGDYNNDGMVDAADYTLWRDNEGTTNHLMNDLIGGTIDEDQYTQWRDNFGKTAGSGAGAGSAGSAPVPEPASATLLLLGAAVLVVSSRPLRR